MATPARFIVDIPSQNPDLFYACGFDAPDACIFFEHRGHRALVLSDLEYDRGVRFATVDTVLSLSHYAARAKKRGVPGSTANIIVEICRERKIRSIHVPHSMFAGVVEALRDARLRVHISPEPFFPERLIKSPAEVRHMRRAMDVTFEAIGVGATMIRQSRIGPRDALIWKGQPLTSERIRTAMSGFLMERGYQAGADIIVASGNDATEPHNYGSGPLKAHSAIIIDCFPRDTKSGFYGDATRTYCRGKASETLRKMYDAVRVAQQAALDLIRDGVDGRIVHNAVHASFLAAGFKTGELRGFRQGFIHGTGHGLGLAIHEEPVRINAGKFTLRAGHVVTVEPGLYYRNVGGIRLEDVVLVTKSGHKLLSTYPKRFEL